LNENGDFLSKTQRNRIKPFALGPAIAVMLTFIHATVFYHRRQRIYGIDSAACIFAADDGLGPV
jgi:hypothetical protein